MSLEWTNLIWDVKRQIIGLLDYESRCNLRICSKQDKIHVDSTKFVANTLSIKEIDSSEDYQKSIIRIDVDDFTIWFIGKHNKTKVERNWNGVLSELEEFKQENRFQVAKRYIDKFLVKNNTISANSVIIYGIKFTPLKHWIIKCQEMLFDYTTSSVRWLRQTIPKLRKLLIFGYIFGNLEELLQIINVSESIRVVDHNYINLSDKLLRAIETPDVLLRSFIFTTEGIKIAFDRFLRIGKKGDKFTVSQFNNISQRGLFWNKLVKNLKVKVVAGDVSDVQQDQSESYKARIIGGFVNIHGVQDIRLLECEFSYTQVTVNCEIWEKPNLWNRTPCVLYPFTENERENIDFRGFS